MRPTWTAFYLAGAIEFPVMNNVVQQSSFKPRICNRETLNSAWLQVSTASELVSREAEWHSGKNISFEFQACLGRNPGSALVLCLWASDLTSLNLHFLLKVGLILSSLRVTGNSMHTKILVQCVAPFSSYHIRKRIPGYVLFVEKSLLAHWPQS